MSKTTKLVKAINSIITFQRKFPQGIQSVTIKGKEDLADLNLDRNNDMDLHLNADKDKVNNVSSSLPYLQATTSTTGSDPDKQKNVALTQDLTQFPITNGELVTVTKTADNLTINDSKVKELVESKAEALKKELGAGTGATTPASTLTLNGGELVTVDKAGDTLTLNDSKVKELVENTNTEILKDVNPIMNKLPNVYNLSANEVLNAEYTISGGTLAYSTFVISTIHNGQYENNFVFIPLLNQVTKKLSNNLIVRITPRPESAYIELFFKEATDVNISGLDFSGGISSPTLMDNVLSETFDDVNNSLFATSGNVPQPFDEGYDTL